MPQPRGQKRIPGHKRTEADGLAACECGWTPAKGFPDCASTPSTANKLRGFHLADVRDGYPRTVYGNGRSEVVFAW